MKEKIIVCDSSSLISLSQTCLLQLLERLPFRFVIPKKVYFETIKRPLSIKRYEYWAMLVKGLVEKEVIEVKDGGIEDLAKKIKDLSNNLFLLRGRPLKIVHEGEAYALALALKMGDVFMVDERTMREVIEDPYMLKSYLQSRMGERIKINKGVVKKLNDLVGDYPVMRSSEVIAMAYDLGIVNWDPDFFRAALYAVKFSGCAITMDEIKEYAGMFG